MRKGYSVAAVVSALNETGEWWREAHCGLLLVMSPHLVCLAQALTYFSAPHICSTKCMIKVSQMQYIKRYI